MAKRYVALLRGINVGGRLIAMSELKRCFEKAGMTDVVTVLQSGNVIFSSSDSLPKLRSRLEAEVSQRFNYPAKILIYPRSSVETILKHYPFPASDPARQYHIVFIDQTRADELVQLARDLDTKVEQVQAGQDCVYWTVPKGMTVRSEFAKRLAQAKFRDFNTIRTRSTVEKILAV